MNKLFYLLRMIVMTCLSVFVITQAYAIINVTQYFIYKNNNNGNLELYRYKDFTESGQLAAGIGFWSIMILIIFSVPLFILNKKYRLLDQREFQIMKIIFIVTLFLFIIVSGPAFLRVG